MITPQNKARLMTVKGMLIDFIEQAIDNREQAELITRKYFSELAEIFRRNELPPPQDNVKVPVIPEIDLCFQRNLMTINLHWHRKGYGHIYAVLEAKHNGYQPGELHMAVGTKKDTNAALEPIIKKQYSIPVEMEQVEGMYDF